MHILLIVKIIHVNLRNAYYPNMVSQMYVRNIVDVLWSGNSER